jgi:uracil-DNA glycosylase
MTRSYLQSQAEIGMPEWILPKPAPKSKDLSDNLISDLASYQSSMTACNRCDLSKTRTHLVFGAGNPSARLMVIGEAPGHDEDIQGEPFVGQAGQLLNKILAAVGFDREEVYIANILKCRPPNNRDPQPDEIAECLPHLTRQIELIGPKLILLLGRIAAQGLFHSLDSLTQFRGKIHQFQGVPVVVTYHPAALLRNPQWKVQTWEDVQKLRRMYDETVGDKAPWRP